MSTELKIARYSIDIIHVEVPEPLRELFERAMVEVTTHPMRLKDGIECAAHLFQDAEFDDAALEKFRQNVLALGQGSAFQADGYLFVLNVDEPEASR